MRNFIMSLYGLAALILALAGGFFLYVAIRGLILTLK